MKFSSSLVALLVLAQGSALAADCNAVNQAIAKLSTVPYSQTIVSRLSNGTQSVSRGILVNDVLYTQTPLSPDWYAMPFKPSDIHKSLGSLMLLGKDSTCDAAGSETVSGEEADIVDAKDRAMGVEIAIRFWISRKSGLALKAYSKGPANGFVDSLTQTFDYADVKPPEHFTNLSDLLAPPQKKKKK